MTAPKISVITINLDNREGLAKTISSVAAQNYSSIEYLVIDGGSTDGSAELLNDPNIHYAVSAADNGIYEAMNKGIAAATGDYCLFLNSGDHLHQPDTISKAVDSFDPDDLADIYFGDLVINGRILDYPAVVSLELLLNRSLPHPASFISRPLFDPGCLGPYRETFRIVSDWIFFLEAYLRQRRFVHLDLPVTVFDPQGISNNQELNAAERTSALQSVFPNLAADTGYFRQLAQYRSSRVYWYADRLYSWMRKLDK